MTSEQSRATWERHKDWLERQLRDARAGIKALEDELAIANERIAEIQENHDTNDEQRTT